MLSLRTFSNADLAKLTATERGELLRRLRTEPLWQFAPLPQSPGQQQFMRAARARRHEMMVLLGGNRSGKTQCGAVAFAEWLLWAAPREMRERGHERATFWMITKQVETAGELIWKPYLSRLIHPRNVRAIAWNNKSKEYPSYVRLHNGVELLFKGWEQDRQAFQGKALYGAWFDEQCPMDIVEEVDARCIDYAAPRIYTLTPLEPDPDLQQKYDEQEPGWRFFEIAIDDNRKSRGGTIDDEAIDRAIASWPAARRETRRRGKFLQLEGAIYGEFSRSIHVGDFTPADIPRTWQRFRGIDFGFRNPFCCLWAARDPDGVWWVYDEHYEAGWKIEEHAPVIHRKSHQQVFAATYADTGGDVMPTGPEGYRISARKELQKHSIHVSNAVRDLWSGIESVQRALMVREFDAGLKLPGLKVSRSHCPNLIRELPSYRVVPDGDGVHGPKETPVKRDDHACDALRYIIHSAEAARVEKPKRIAGPSQTRV